MEKLLIIGAGYLAEEVVSFIQRYDLFEIIGFAVDTNYIKEEHMGYPVYNLKNIENGIDKNEAKIFIAISWYQYLNKYKREKYDELKAKGFHFANLISPSATVLSQDIGEGNWIDDQVYIAYGSSIGSNNTFRPCSYVAHHSSIGNHNVLSIKSTICGSVTMGDCSFIGASALVFNKVRIGNKCIVGGGAIAKRDLLDYSMVVASDCYIKQCDENSIEKYISLEHFQK